MSISVFSWQLLNAMESVDLTNHNSGGHEKVSQADLALRPASITSLTVTSEISLHYQHTSKEACEPLTLHHPFISPHTRSSLADVNFRLLICVLWEYEYVRICFLWEYELPLLFLHKIKTPKRKSAAESIRKRFIKVQYLQSVIEFHRI